MNLFQKYFKMNGVEMIQAQQAAQVASAIDDPNLEASQTNLIVNYLPQTMSQVLNNANFDILELDLPTYLDFPGGDPVTVCLYW